MKWLPWLLIGGVGAYLWWRSSPSVQAFAAENLGVTPPNPYLLRQPTLAPGNAPRQSAPTSGPGSPIPGAITSVGTATLVGALGPGSAVIGAMTAGIAAGVAIITWGIVEKGWFRGGEEGVKVNPLRDQFLQTWIDIYFPGSGSEKQYEAMVRATQEANLDGNTANRIITAIYDADTVDEFTAAATLFVRTLQHAA